MHLQSRLYNANSFIRYTRLIYCVQRHLLRSSDPRRMQPSKQLRRRYGINELDHGRHEWHSVLPYMDINHIDDILKVFLAVFEVRLDLAL